jgi:hypothetical protein
VREPGTLPHDVADAKAPALQCDKVHPGDDEVAAQYRRRNLLDTGERRNDIEVLSLQHGDAAVAAATTVMVAFKPPTDGGAGIVGTGNRRALRGPRAAGRGPIHCTRPGRGKHCTRNTRALLFNRGMGGGMISMSYRPFDLGIALAIAVAVSLPAVASATENAPLTELASLRWQHRILVVDGRIPGSVVRLRAAQPAIDERDIVWFVASPDGLLSNYPGEVGDALAQDLDERYFGRSDARVFLIGKDGGLKSSERELDLQRLFARIDAMPMRRREMEAAD